MRIKRYLDYPETLEVHVGVSDSLEKLIDYITNELPALHTELDSRIISEKTAEKIISKVTTQMLERSPLAGPDVLAIRRIPLSTINTIEIYEKPSDPDNDSVYVLGLIVDHVAS